MAKTEKTITINAPVEEVFSYVNDPMSLPEVWPNLVEVKDVQWLPNGGNRFRGVYKMAGIRFEITSEDIECIANERVVSRTEGGIQSTITMKFRPEAGGTRVTVMAEYTLPLPLVGRLAGEIIAKINEKDLVYFLNYLKLKFERKKS